MNILNWFKKDRRTKTVEFRRLYSRLVAQDVIMNMPFTGMWVKNSKFELLEISEQTALLLYNRTSNDCIGLTDYHITREGGCKMTEEQFANICMASDLMLNDNKPKSYIEFVTDTEGGKHIWKTVKAKMCMEGECYYFGFATFLDTIMGYDGAMDKVSNDAQKLDKINDNLFVYK